MTQQQSTTSKIYQHLLTLPETEEFTTAEICQQLNLHDPRDPSRVSAALSHFRKMGLLITVDTKRSTASAGGPSFVYRIVDKNTAITVREHSSPKAVSPHTRKFNGTAATVRSLSERALQLAADIASIQPDLSSIPTAQLLAELVRREKSAANHQPPASNPVTSSDPS